MKPNVKGYYEMGREEIMAVVYGVLPYHEAKLVERAYQLSKYGHRTQMRADGETRYFEHPKAVFLIMLLELRIVDWRYHVVGLMHDQLEDSYQLDVETLTILFDDVVARALVNLTKKPKTGYHERIMWLRSTLVLVAKLCDRLHNMRTLGAMPRAKQLKQVQETREYYLPMADLLYELLSEEAKWWATYLRDEIGELCTFYESQPE